MDIDQFDPNGIGISNGHFMGLPFSEEEAKVVVISVPWDATVSYQDGTALGPENILHASMQIDLLQHGLQDAWKMGVYLRPSDSGWLKTNQKIREKSKAYIQFLEEGGNIGESPKMISILEEVNSSCAEIHEFVYQESKKLLAKNKLPAVLGGEHSSPLGLMRALQEHYGDYGVLQIDAHMDLREAYEGFVFSHASIFYNALNEKYISGLTQVGIRDYCEEEMEFAVANEVSVFYDEDLKTNTFEGLSWAEQCKAIIATLPEKVYISFDIDGLNPHLCPATGTPVPGGLEFAEAIYLIKQVVQSGKKIIGFDLCEVGGSQEWDGNVGARVLYNLCNWAGKSQGLI